MKHITPENLYDFAFLNEDALKRPLKAICVSFHGYTDATMFKESPIDGQLLGEKGIAWVFPYYSVWAWMGRNSQEFNEQVLDAVYERLGADSDIPLIITGGSMGGLTALNYLVYGKRPASACAVNCAVTDLADAYSHYTDFRRAILSAHIDREESLEEVMISYSPVHIADKLPRIPYFLIYGEKDEYFAKNYLPPMEEKLKALGHNYTAMVQPGMAHCGIKAHPEAMDAYFGFIIKQACGEGK